MRSATADDLHFIHDLRVAGLRSHVAPLWGWDDADQFARFEQRFVSDPSRYQVIAVAGTDVGAMAVAWRAREAFLADLEIAPAWRGRGLGTAVIRDVIDEAATLGLPVALQILKGNPARRLYERLGFRVVAETATHHHLRIDVPVDDPFPR